MPATRTGRYALKYRFTPEMVARVEAAWGTRLAPRELTPLIDQMAEDFGFPRYAVVNKARSLGLVNCRKAWTRDEVALLRRSLPALGICGIAKQLGRSFYAVKVRATALGLLGSEWNGYTQDRVAALFHVAPIKVGQWEKLGWLPRDITGAYTQPAMERFLRDHLEVLDLRRVDQAWLQETLANMLRRADVSTDAGYDEVAALTRTPFMSDEDRLVTMRRERNAALLATA